MERCDITSLRFHYQTCVFSPVPAGVSITSASVKKGERGGKRCSGSGYFFVSSAVGEYTLCAALLSVDLTRRTATPGHSRGAQLEQPLPALRDRLQQNPCMESLKALACRGN